MIYSWKNFVAILNPHVHSEISHLRHFILILYKFELINSSSIINSTIPSSQYFYRCSCTRLQLIFRKLYISWLISCLASRRQAKKQIHRADWILFGFYFYDFFFLSLSYFHCLILRQFFSVTIKGNIKIYCHLIGVRNVSALEESKGGLRECEGEASRRKSREWKKSVGVVGSRKFIKCLQTGSEGVWPDYYRKTLLNLASFFFNYKFLAVHEIPFVVVGLEG